MHSSNFFQSPSLAASLILSLLIFLLHPQSVASLPAASPLEVTTLFERYTSADMPSSMCGTEKAKMPEAPKPLPAPCDGCTLTHVVVGRGTQNYTCATSTSASVPEAAGALASLFNTTCLAGTAPTLLRTIAGISLKFPVPGPTLPAASIMMSGMHYFTDLTTPFFDLDTERHKWGKVAVKKGNATAAPEPEKDVPWLKLLQKSREGGCGVSEVYRVNTKGGVPPKSCEGQPKTFEVQYAAEYWMYSGPPEA